MRTLLCLLAIVWLAGCAAPGGRAGDGIYVVKRGDTLYGIAWQHGVDYRALARLNKIEPPYTIQPGQQLRVNAPAPTAARTSTGTLAQTSGRGEGPAALTSSGSGARVSALAPHPGRAPEPLTRQTRRSGRQSVVASGAAAPSATLARDAPPVHRPTLGAPRIVEPDRDAVAQAEGAARSVGDFQWVWPAEGPISKRFSASADGKQGINIRGDVGQMVRAAAPGRVVYSGDGLRGYGNLVIVKHDVTYLTAYGYNNELLVEEGDEVRAGEWIATMGLASGVGAALHFELRQDGKPVDPLSSLPER